VLRVARTARGLRTTDFVSPLRPRAHV